jgi:phosphoheptose isomerase
MKSKNDLLTDEDFDNLQLGLPAISLCSLNALNTAFCNDVHPDYLFAQGTMALGKPGDILICISTSGNSKNVVNAAKVANAICMKVISLTGAGGGKLGTMSAYTVAVPETETFKVQELHLPVYHYLCAEVEKRAFN